MSKCGKCEAHSWRSMMATDVTVWESNELSCLLSTPVLRRLVFLGPVFLKVGLRSSISSFWGARLLPPAAPHAVTPSPVSAARGRSPSLPCPPPVSVCGLLAQPCREFLSQLSPPEPFQEALEVENVFIGTLGPELHVPSCRHRQVAKRGRHLAQIKDAAPRCARSRRVLPPHTLAFKHLPISRKNMLEEAAEGSAL